MTVHWQLLFFALVHGVGAVEFSLSSSAEVDTETYKSFARQLSNDDFTYINQNDTYSPSMWVDYGHMLSGRDFDTSMDYLMRVMYAPIGLCALGLLAMLFLDIGLLFRCCCKACKCEPDRKGEKYAYNRTCNYVWFYILCVLVIVFDMLVFMGNTEVDKGVATTSDAMEDTQSIVKAVYSSGTNLGQSGQDLQVEINDARGSCPAANSDWNTMDSFTTSFIDQINSLTSQMDDIDGNLVTVNDYIDQYAVEYRTIGLWVVWGLSIFSVLLLLSTHACKHTVGIQLSMFFTQLTFFIYIALGILWCFIVSFVGDLCVSPSYNVIKNIPSADIQNIAAYYSTCVGSSDLQTYVDQSISDLQALNNSLESAYFYCPNNDDIASMQTILTDMTDTILTVENDLACPPIQSIWFSIINDGICTELYTGFFYIWGSQLITSFLLFCLVLTVCYMHQFYPKRGVSPDDDEGEDAIDDPMDHRAFSEEDEDDRFMREYKKKQQQNNNSGSYGDGHKNNSHAVVDKNHRLPHQVQTQGGDDDDDDAFFV